MKIVALISRRDAAGDDAHHEDVLSGEIGARTHFDVRESKCAEIALKSADFREFWFRTFRSKIQILK